MIIISQNKDSVVTNFNALFIEAYEEVNTIKANVGGATLEIGTYNKDKAQEILHSIVQYKINEKKFKDEALFMMPPNIYLVLRHAANIGEVRKVMPWGETVILTKTDVATAKKLYEHYDELGRPGCDVEALKAVILNNKNLKGDA